MAAAVWLPFSLCVCFAFGAEIGRQGRGGGRGMCHLSGKRIFLKSRTRQWIGAPSLVRSTRRPCGARAACAVALTGISFSSSPSPGSPVRAVFDRQFTLEIAPECLIGLPPGWPYENEIHAWLATRTRVLYFLHAQIERDPSIFLSLYRPAFFFSFGQTNSANLPSTESQKKIRYCKIRYRNVLLNIHTN